MKKKKIVDGRAARYDPAPCVIEWIGRAFGYDVRNCVFLSSWEMYQTPVGIDSVFCTGCLLWRDTLVWGSVVMVGHLILILQVPTF